MPKIWVYPAFVLLLLAAPHPRRAAARRGDVSSVSLPLTFVSNHGQFDPAVRFFARSRGCNLFFTDTEAIVQPGRGAPVHIRLAGANARPRVSGRAEQPGRSNYFVGKDASRWRTAIPTFAQVAYEAVYPGVDLVYYGAKMYILSPESGQVYKDQRTASGFDGGSAWIISGVSSLVDATALTIDGYIWILKADGTIVRYLAGKETDWRLGVVEPPLLNTKDIWTNENSKFLYVLDPNEKRVVVFDKEKGTLVTQYTNDQFTDLKSMIVDEANKKITVLAGSKVYQFELKN